MHPPPLDVGELIAARARRGLVAVFDLDGTLVPIARSPAAVRVPSGLEGALALLASRSDTVVGIVSGRPIAQVARLVGSSGLWLVGLHGYERRRPGGAIERLWSAAAALQGRALGRLLQDRLPAHATVRLEYKGPLVAVHVRGLPPGVRARVEAVVRASCPPGHVVLAGRRVFEFRATGAPTKGDGVRWIAAAKPGAAVLFVGDDVTDEDGFAVLDGRDFAVQVTDSAAARERASSGTRARFSLDGPAAVRRVLDALAGTRACPLGTVSVAKARDASSARRRRRRDLSGSPGGARPR